MAAWINLSLLLLPMIITLAPLWVMTSMLDNTDEHDFVGRRHARKWAGVFLGIYLLVMAIHIFMVPRLLSLPTYHV